MASMTRSTAPVTNGPIPSPGISVTLRVDPSPGRGMYVTDRVVDLRMDKDFFDGFMRCFRVCSDCCLDMFG